MRGQAAMVSLGTKMLLRTALTHDAHLIEAHMALAERCRKEHQTAETGLDSHGALRAEVNLRGQLQHIPRGTDGRSELTDYLAGEGHLTLVTKPAGLTAILYRYEMQNRRLVEVYERALGLTPLSKTSIPMGSYMIEFRGHGRATTRYPVLVERQSHWTGVSPDGDSALPVDIPHENELDTHEVYIPAGWFWSGGDTQAPAPLKRRVVWCDAFIMTCLPVTNREFLRFLNELVNDGQAETALCYVPRERGGTAAALGAMIYGRNHQGYFQLVPDSDGDLWSLDWPVVMVNYAGAQAYGAWWAQKTGKPWSLPPELAWEKAARGVDGRYFPWGNFLDPSWCCMGHSHAKRPLLADVKAYETDTSPYGVRSMAGNVRQLCADVFADGGPNLKGQRVNLTPQGPSNTQVTVMRGGAWGSDPRDCRSANRSFILPGDRQPGIGFRLFRPYLTT
jgi:formylglycine-generating enzyme required for sulfatase activity